MRARAANRQRWVMSFADLCLLLTGFFVLLHAQTIDPVRLAAGMRAGFGEMPTASVPLDLAATDLFVPGEAILTPAADARLRRAGASATRRGERASVIGIGSDAGGSRLDRWELAAARAAAVARALGRGGLPEARIAVALPRTDGAARQRITVAFGR